ncbi:TetR/AcrR family transcriptional regulator [Phyllobacterium lublinensis]|uniref:TetR/AcrR family transcriptional regulator n=1 Tax=Phyllobacterium lublinensis TaxID=2875708 RepID=UPI001CCD093E|nr:TetR/AcrR family transcriptional regulator [Phyllobacterium sp. 2063]MBZ9655409.1 TetR/AcrR family transcriptional regulator [Phyllobacterium sp. 2063]
MRVSREQVAKNRERIIEVAGRAFREKGFDGIGVADLMKGAGLTHGGFYGHFASKDDLIAEASAAVMDRSTVKWEKLAETSPDKALAAIVSSYLDKSHRDNAGTGCLIAALAPDIARQKETVRARFTQGTQSLLRVLAKAIPGQSEAARREKAIATLAGLVGTIVLSRAVDDPKFADEILHAGQEVFSRK